MKQYPDYKYKPRRKPKNALPSSTSAGSLHSSNNLAASPTAALNNMMSNLQNGTTQQTAAAALAAITNAVASADPTQSSNSLSAQSLLNLGQNLNAFNLRDFPVLFPRMNNAVAAALSGSAASPANSGIPVSTNQQYGAFNSSLLNGSFLNPAIYSTAKQNQLLATLNGNQKRQPSNQSTNGSYPANRAASPIYPSTSFNSTTVNPAPTLTASSNLLQLSANNDAAYLAALHQQFLLNQQQQQFLLNNANNGAAAQQPQYSPDDALSNYFNSNLASSPIKAANSSLSIDNLVNSTSNQLTKKQPSNGEQANGKRSHDGSDDETIEENLEDEEDADYNEEISSLLEKRKDSGSSKEENGAQKKNTSTNYLKRSIDSVLNERIIDNNNNSASDKKSVDYSDQPSKHFKSLNGQESFESNDQKLNNNLANNLAENLTTNLFNTLQRTYNLSPTLMLDNVKRFFSRLPTSTSPPIGSLAGGGGGGSKAPFAENYLSKALQLPNGNNSFSTLNNELANQTNQAGANQAASLLSSLKPRLLDDLYYDNAAAGNFLEFYSQLLIKQANGRTPSNDSFDLHKKSSSLIL